MDDFLAEATPRPKLDMIRQYQAQGHLVAMTGDGTNDAPALAQADVAVAMNSGTRRLKRRATWLIWTPPHQANRHRADRQTAADDPRSLTTFSIANDIAKYFAIIPAIFAEPVSRPCRLEHHGAAKPVQRHPLRADLQRADHLLR